MQAFIGGFVGTPGAGGPADAATGYLAPTCQAILDHDIVYENQYTLILGTVAEIRGYVTARAAKPAPPEYKFATDRQHWRYGNATDTGWPIAGQLNIRLEHDDPQMIGPAGLWDAAAAPWLSLEAAFHTGGRIAQLFWSRLDTAGFREDQSLQFDVIPDGRFRTYTVDLSASPTYRGAITRLRLDPEDSGRPGDFALVRSIGFSQPRL